MLTTVLIIGVINLALGFALALLLENPAVLQYAAGLRGAHVPAWVERVVRRLTVVDSTLDAPEPAVPTPPAEEVSTAPVVESAKFKLPSLDPEEERLWSQLPVEWNELLKSQQLRPKSFVEALLWVVRHNLPQFRDQLLQVSQQCFNEISPPEIDDFQRQLCHAWPGQLNDWASTLTDVPGPPRHLDVSEKYQKVLTWQASLAQAAADEIDAGMRGETPAEAKDLRAPTCKLVETVDTIRDQTDDALHKILVDEQRFRETANRFQPRSPSPVLTRMDLAVLVRDWAGQDTDRMRLVCGVMMNIDRFGEINRQFGTVVGDTLLAGVSELLKDLLRKDRGFDRVARISGDTFLLFLGDTGLRNAIKGAERFRNSLQAAVFHVAEEEFRVTASCGVSEWPKQESPDNWFDRLQFLVTQAKQAGRNCTCALDETGVRFVPPGQPILQPRHVTL